MKSEFFQFRVFVRFSLSTDTRQQLTVVLIQTPMWIFFKIKITDGLNLENDRAIGKLVAECEDDVTELMDCQKKMVHALARCFPLRKLDVITRSQDCSVYSETGSCFRPVRLRSSVFGLWVFVFDTPISEGGLAQSLESNRAFEYLNLSHNRQGGDSVAVALARTLETTCSVKYLNLSQCFDATAKNAPIPGSE